LIVLYSFTTAKCMMQLNSCTCINVHHIRWTFEALSLEITYLHH